MELWVTELSETEKSEVMIQSRSGTRESCALPVEQSLTQFPRQFPPTSTIKTLTPFQFIHFP